MLARINHFAPLGFGPRRRAGNSMFHVLEQEMDHLFRNFEARSFEPETNRLGPALDIEEKEDSFFVRIEVPGFAEKDLDVSLEQDRLVISGERKATAPEGEEPRTLAKFKRELRLGNLVNAADASATLEHGILSLELPKVKNPEPRRIAIKGS